MRSPVIFPRLAINQIVEIKGERYRTEIWEQKDIITYEFIYLGENGLRNFEKSEIDVSNALKNNIIKII
jgi:hypothetical protein